MHKFFFVLPRHYHAKTKQTGKQNKILLYQTVRHCSLNFIQINIISKTIQIVENCKKENESFPRSVLLKGRQVTRNTTCMNQYGLSINARNKTECETCNQTSRTPVSRDSYFCAKVAAHTNYGRLF